MAKENVEVLEKGHIYFFYRPKIDVKDDIKNKEDVQNFYCALSPKDDKHSRLLIIGKEALPELSNHEKFWGFVSRASISKKQIKEELESYTYQTKTKGKREQPAARPCGEGVYRILQHDDHTHLVYALEYPKKRDEVQKAFNIEREGNYIINVKNPEKGQPKNAGMPQDQKADFPKRLTEKFEDRRFVPVNPSDFLNYENAEILFIGINEDIKKELGVELKPEKESRKNADIYNDLNLDKEENPVAPLFKGKWE
tara:strand:+ start:14509 stop:15270 length:762 start_codon:yes stop_codon:yes gene_type:complete